MTDNRSSNCIIINLQKFCDQTVKMESFKDCRRHNLFPELTCVSFIFVVCVFSVHFLHLLKFHNSSHYKNYLIWEIVDLLAKQFERYEFDSLWDLRVIIPMLRHAELWTVPCRPFFFCFDTAASSCLPHIPSEDRIHVIFLNAPIRSWTHSCASQVIVSRHNITSASLNLYISTAWACLYLSPVSILLISTTGMWRRRGNMMILCQSLFLLLRK